ncbi:MAG TPA: hypothetical protein VNA24_15370 [Hyalangium sp.]|nr:hypothetical protein [Hyalangium sp.]
MRQPSAGIETAADLAERAGAQFVLGDDLRRRALAVQMLAWELPATLERT